MIISLGININNLKAQDYDRVSNMLEPHSKVGCLLQEEYPSALYSHCLCHSLNLSVLSINTVSRSIKDMMDVSLEIARLIKFSLKRKRKLGKIFAFEFLKYNYI